MSDQKKVQATSKTIQGLPYLAAVMIRSPISKNPDQKKALDLLKFRKRHVCIVLKNTPQNRGMLVTVKDVVTFGEIDEATFKFLQDKRGKMTLNHEGVSVQKPFFSLHPPRGGFERKGIKTDFKSGGVLGYRGHAIKALIERMV